MMKKWTLILLTVFVLAIWIPALSEDAGYPEKVFDEPKQEYTVTEKDGLVIPIDLKGMPVRNIEHKAANDKSFLHYLDESGLHILPIEKGKATVTLTNKLNKKDKTVITVIIDDAAVYAKGEESPLRVYIVPNELYYTNNKCEGKFVILGGSGKYSYIKVDGEAIGPGIQYESLGIMKIKGKDKGTFSCELLEEMIRLKVIVDDEDGKEVIAYSPIVFHEPDMQVGLDTYHIYSVPGEKREDKIFIRGGTPPYNVELSYADTKIKIKAEQGENDLAYDAPRHESYVRISVKDKAKNKYEGVTMVEENEEYGKTVALRTDKPFAKVGDEINITTIFGDSIGKDMTCTFFYWVKDPVNFTYKKISVSNASKTETGYSFIAEYAGMITADISIQGHGGPADIPLGKVSAQ